VECASLWIAIAELDARTLAFHVEVIQRAETIMSVSGLRHWFALKRLEYRETSLHVEPPLLMNHISIFLDPLQDIIESSEYEDGDSNSTELNGVRGAVGDRVASVCLCTLADPQGRPDPLCEGCALEREEWHGVGS
jgi:hypothetical protein